MGEQQIRNDASAETKEGSDNTNAGLSSASNLADQTNSALISSGNHKYDHIIVVVEENHGFGDKNGSDTGIIGNKEAPFINLLANDGRLFVDAHAITHPSQPNYLALFSGSTQGVSDDKRHSFKNVPNLATQLEKAGMSFTGYAENGSPFKHNPWQGFDNAQHVGTDLKNFPTDFNELPTVSFVVPNLDNDMHDGTIGEADTWLKDNLGSYAQWAKSHNSLLIVMTDEDDGLEDNRIPVIVYGDGVNPSESTQTINTVGVLHGIEKQYGLPFLGNNADAADLDQH